MIFKTTVAHICKHIKQISKHHSIIEAQHNVIGTQHGIIKTQHNTSKHNSVFAKHNANLPKHNTIFAKHNTKFSRLRQYYTKYKPIIAQPLTCFALSRHFCLPFCLEKMFCASCRAGLKSFSKFCPFCWQKVENDSSANVTDEGATKCASFKNYAAKKSEERSTHFRSSGSKRRGQKKKEEDPFALINMGLMWFIGPDVRTPNRGKTLPLEVRKDSGYAEVFAEALVKRQAHDQAFDSKKGRKLVYPDRQLAMNLPGQLEKEFTLRNYQKDLGKPYNRITLYLCPEEPEDEFILDSETETEPDTQGVRVRYLVTLSYLCPWVFWALRTRKGGRGNYTRGEIKLAFIWTLYSLQNVKSYILFQYFFQKPKLTLFQFNILLSSLWILSGILY